ncbi:MAG: Xaa-Pro peptidase family protein [Pseudomonadota bacterium]
MAERSLIFPTGEFQKRTDELQRQMDRHGIDALLLTTAPDIFYVTGFLTRFWESPARPWYVVVPAKGALTAVIPSIGLDLMRRTWVDDIRTWQAPNPDESGVAQLADAICDCVPEAGQIGVPMGLETQIRMPLADFFELERVIAPRQIVDATACVQRVRERKSEDEIARVRHVCGIAALAFDQVSSFAAPGVGLDHVFAEFQVACLRAGADWVSYVAGAAGQGGYGDVISPAAARPLEQGDILMLDTGAVCEGYFCDFDRNFSMGQPYDDATRAHDALWQATEDVLGAMMPGQRASDVHQMLCDALIRRGAKPGAGRLGHGLGLSLTEWPSISAVDDTVLVENMVLTLEPSAVIAAGKMMVHEEVIVLRADGAELLSPRAPAALPVIGQ